ncbi:MAG TPA: NIPSNAP family protein [Rhodanobacteraceae bacterium]|nr:NIPSNAP family protein [Rhodanobacteraceae bacterium]
MSTASPIVELRQYTLHPGARETLIELFDREFVETQEACGMKVIGQFRDLDDPDRFVWLRGFPDMPARARALAAFYGGPVWKAHRNAANATMIDSDNVLLLRPVAPDAGFDLADATRAPVGRREISEELVVATLYVFDAPVDREFLDFFAREIEPVLVASGAPPRAQFVTEYAANNFPALPVREGEHVFAWFAGFADHAAYARHLAALTASPEWRVLVPALRRQLLAPPQTLRLAPTARSLLRPARTATSPVPLTETLS